MSKCLCGSTDCPACWFEEAREIRTLPEQQAYDQALPYLEDPPEWVYDEEKESV